MKELLKYRGYRGTVKYDRIDNLYYGTVQLIDEHISYEGKNMFLLTNAFKQLIDEYCERKVSVV